MHSIHPNNNSIKRPNIIIRCCAKIKLINLIHIVASIVNICIHIVFLIYAIRYINNKCYIDKCNSDILPDIGIILIITTVILNFALSIFMPLFIMFENYNISVTKIIHTIFTILYLTFNICSLIVLKSSSDLNTKNMGKIQKSDYDNSIFVCVMNIVPSGIWLFFYTIYNCYKFTEYSRRKV